MHVVFGVHHPWILGCAPVGGLSDLEVVFRGGRDTTDQHFILNEVIMMRKEHGMPTCAAFLDIAKAYDRVWQPGLWLNCSGVV